MPAPAAESKRAVAEIAQICLNGDKKYNLSKHLASVLVDKALYHNQSKVLQHHLEKNVRLPYLL